MVGDLFGGEVPEAERAKVKDGGIIIIFFFFSSKQKTINFFFEGGLVHD